MPTAASLSDDLKAAEKSLQSAGGMINTILSKPGEVSVCCRSLDTTLDTTPGLGIPLNQSMLSYVTDAAAAPCSFPTFLNALHQTFCRTGRSLALTRRQLPTPWPSRPLVARARATGATCWERHGGQLCICFLSLMKGCWLHVPAV